MSSAQLDVADLESLVEQRDARGPRHRSELDATAPERVNFRRAWYQHLLAQTMTIAAERVPHYRARPEYSWASREPELLAAFRSLPVVTKEQLASNVADFLNDQVEHDTVRCTSGTTGRRLLLYGNTREDRAKRALLRLQTPEAGQDRLSLRLVPGPRRVASAGPSSAGVAPLQVGYDYNDRVGQWFDSTDYIAELLTDEFRLSGVSRRIEVLHVTPPWLLDVLTSRLVVRGMAPSEIAAVGTIVLSGGSTAQATRETCRAMWRAQPVMSFSCTEIRGEALAWEDEQTFAPGLSMFTEVLDVDTAAPVEPGEDGKLVLTGLHPFQESTVLVRYETSDIVRRAGGAGDLVERFTPLGRQSHCTLIGPRRFVGTSVIADVLSNHEEIPGIPFPRFSTTWDAISRTLAVNVETNPIPDARLREMGRAIEQALASQLDVGSRVVADLVPKGSLRHFVALYPDR